MYHDSLQEGESETESQQVIKRAFLPMKKVIARKNLLKMTVMIRLKMMKVHLMM